ncbi:MAG: ABC transporter permease [Chloroflexota bacterium]|nr:MAG: peptide ABC transporter [Chloroflexota bacterium]
MTAHIARRVLLAVPTLWVVLTLVFVGFRLVPGDAAQSMIAQATQQHSGAGGASDVQRLRHQLGIDRPLAVQYFDFLGSAVRLDFGRSFSTNRPVFEEIESRLPYTAELAGSALVLTTLFGIAAGVLAAVRHRTATGTLVAALAVVGISVPNFFLGTMLAVVFGVQLHWLPVAGTGGIRHLVLPSVTLAFGLCAVLTRYVRASLLDTLQQDFVRTARAKGLTERVVIMRHALRNALVPVVTILGLMFAGLLNGAIIVENVFAWPGLGTMVLEAINGRDYPLIEGTTFFIALVFIGANLLVDISYSFLDKRIDYS